MSVSVISTGDKLYSTQWHDCCGKPCGSDVPTCAYAYFCTPCAICDVSVGLHVDTHRVKGFCDAYWSTVCWPAVLCCGGCGGCCMLCNCKKGNMFPCFISKLVDKSMEIHGIKKHIGPCGSFSCGEGDEKCYWGTLLCSSCMICVMLRENALHPVPAPAPKAEA